METSKGMKIVTIIAVFVLIGGLIFSLMYGLRLGSVSDEADGVSLQLEQKRRELALYDADEPDVEVVSVDMASAKAAGEEIAEAINEEKELFYTFKFDEGKKVQQQITQYFADKFTNGSGWYYFDGNCADGTKMAPSHWEFKTTYEYSGRKIDCLWLCMHESCELPVAYMTATYDAETGIFSEPVHCETIYGVNLRSLEPVDDPVSNPNGISTLEDAGALEEEAD